MAKKLRLPAFSGKTELIANRRGAKRKRGQRDTDQIISEKM